MPLETGLLSAVIGAVYKSKSVALVNFRTAEPLGKLALYAAGSVTLVPVTWVGDGLPGLRATLNVSGLALRLKVRPVSTEALVPAGKLTFRVRSTPRKLTV
ncbi:hypothetical protein D3C84_724030 [compost metagenome]